MERYIGSDTFLPMRIFLFVLLLLSLACRSAEPEVSPPALPNTSPTLENADIKILFIGNSLTYTNNLPALVSELARLDNKVLAFTSIAKPNYAIIDHWGEGDAQREIESDAYHFVIAQQGPSALPESQVLLLEGATPYAELCKKNNSQFALYMVWPSKSRSFDHDNVIFSYSQAAEKTESLLCPAGLAWKYAWEVDDDLPLYGPDFFHPSVMGSVLAAMTIYGSIAKKSDFEFVNHASVSWRDNVSEVQLSVLKQAALKALGN